jgi:hypothetical protein
MKLRLNKKVLSEMPQEVRELVLAWKEKYHKSKISVENVTQFYAREDAKITIINLLTGMSQTERVAGEFAGMTKLSPTATVPLPENCVAVVTGIFCGMPWLTLYQGSKTQILAPQ